MATVPRLTKEQAAVVGAYTGVTCGPYSDIVEYAERFFGKGLTDRGMMTLATALREKSETDFLSICFEPETAADVTCPTCDGTGESSVLEAIMRDCPYLHQRRCWDCGKTHWHADRITPCVLCPECKSQDTRIVKGAPTNGN